MGYIYFYLQQLEDFFSQPFNLTEFEVVLKKDDFVYQRIFFKFLLRSKDELFIVEMLKYLLQEGLQYEKFSFQFIFHIFINIARNEDLKSLFSAKSELFMLKDRFVYAIFTIFNNTSHISELREIEYWAAYCQLKMFIFTLNSSLFEYSFGKNVSHLMLLLIEIIFNYDETIRLSFKVIKKIQELTLRGNTICDSVCQLLAFCSTESFKNIILRKYEAHLCLPYYISSLKGILLSYLQIQMRTILIYNKIYEEDTTLLWHSINDCIQSYMHRKNMDRSFEGCLVHIFSEDDEDCLEMLSLMTLLTVENKNERQLYYPVILMIEYLDSIEQDYWFIADSLLNRKMTGLIFWLRITKFMIKNKDTFYQSLNKKQLGSLWNFCHNMARILQCKNLFKFKTNILVNRLYEVIKVVNTLL